MAGGGRGITSSPLGFPGSGLNSPNPLTPPQKALAHNRLQVLFIHVFQGDPVDNLACRLPELSGPFSLASWW